MNCWNNQQKQESVASRLCCCQKSRRKTTLYGFQPNAMIVSYWLKKKKEKLSLYLVQCIWKRAKKEEITRNIEVILHYNPIKSGIDIMDHMVRCYNTK